MTPIDRFERQLPMALTDLAEPRTPDYLVDILGQTARTRQRPAWASLERWLPMDIASTTRPVRGAPWRQLGVLALLAVLLATAVAVYVGSRRSEPNLPTPFGRAVNGLIPYAIDGDLFAGDPVTGRSELLLPGDTYDYDPFYSRDGTRIAFTRRVDPTIEGLDYLMVMAADGTGAQQIAAEPLQGLAWWDWSPSGDALIAVHEIEGIPAFQLFDSNGVEAPRPLAEGIQVVHPSFRPPDGAEILFRGETADGASLYVMNADGTDIRQLTDPITFDTGDFSLTQPRYSPDGSQIAYHLWDQELGNMRLWVMDADGTDPRALSADTGTYFLAWPVWSNDGTRIAAQRSRDLPGDETESNFVIIDVEDGTVIKTGPNLPQEGGTIEWAPDDSSLLMVPNIDGGRHLFLDPTGGPWTEAAWDSGSFPGWQRKAD